MDLREFLKLLTPDGKLVVAQKVEVIRDGRAFSTFRHAVRNSHDAAARAIEEMPDGCDIYYALAAFERGFHKNEKGKKVVRVRSNVRALRALWLDIDHKSGLGSTEAVVRAVAAFCKASGMPVPSVIVNSGNGEHVYWALERDLPLEDWLPLAEGLKATAAAHGLQADLACTGDPCRVLRPPGTQNWKDPQDPKPVKVVFTSQKIYSPERLTSSLNSAPTLPSHLRNHAASYDEFTGGVGAASRESSFERVATKCGVMAHVLETEGAECDEPEWKAVLQLLKHCTDGAKYVHEVSKGHPGYSPQETEEKWEQRLENDAGPTLCRTFETWHPELCARCPHYRKIKTPKTLGEEFKPAAKEEPKKTKKVKQVPVASTHLPDNWRESPRGYGMDKRETDAKSGGTSWKRMLDWTIRDVEASRSVENGNMVVSFSADCGGASPIQFSDKPTSFFGNANKLREEMAASGVVLVGPQAAAFADLMGNWLREIKAANEVGDSVSRLGWIADKEIEDGADLDVTGFTTASQTFYCDGRAPRRGLHIAREYEAIGRMYIPAGSPEPWQEAAAFLTEQNNPAFTAVLASAFAAPLVRFSEVQGGVLSVVSRESGVGKSSALKCAQAVWGDPYRAMNSMDDTPLSVARKVGFLNNLPAYWDEIRGEKTLQGFVQLAFQITQGKEKTRLDSTAALKEVQNWQTLLVVASNKSIFDAMAQYTGDSDAGVARTFEIVVEPFDTDKSRAEVGALFMHLSSHYGWAGVAYAEYLAENAREIKELMHDRFTKLAAKLDMQASERFWFSIATTLIVGAELAYKAGIIKIDIKELTMFLVSRINELRARSKESMEGTTAPELVAKFLHDMQGETLLVDKLPPVAGGRNSDYSCVVKRAPTQHRLSVVRHTEKNLVGGRKFLASKALFRQWLVTHGTSVANFKRAATEAGLSVTEHKYVLGKGTPYELSRQWVFQITEPDSVDLISADSSHPGDTSDSSSD